jgi:DNA polymerase-3 subunit chi
VLVDFYHLTASPLERVLPSICEKLLAGGQRVLIVADEALLDPLDAQLWTSWADSFLPHGRAGAPAPEAQPILLSSSVEALNGARNVALADGRWRDEALGFDRVFYFFGAETLDGSRAAWRALKERPETDLRYWKQQAGKWVEGP